MRDASWTLAMLALAFSFGTARADEAWVLSDGAEVTYEAEIGDIAVLSYRFRGSEVRLYVPGLPRSLDSRGTFYGYWIEPGQGSYCGAELVGADGESSTSWGQAVITFDRPSFPSGWTGQLGRCFEEPTNPLRADAIYGDQIVVPR